MNGEKSTVSWLYIIEAVFYRYNNINKRANSVVMTARRAFIISTNVRETNETATPSALSYFIMRRETNEFHN